MYAYRDLSYFEKLVVVDCGRCLCATHPGLNVTTANCTARGLIAFPLAASIANTLYLDGNNITAIFLAQLSTYESLKTLVLDNNAITSIDSDAWDQTPSLTSLSLANNLLTEGSIAGRLPATLEELVLSGNPLTAIRADLLAGLTQLRVLRLNHMGHVQYIQTNFLHVAGLLQVTTLTMGGTGAGISASACKLAAGALKLLPTCTCAADLGPGTVSATGKYGCVPRPIPGATPANVSISYLSSNIAEISATLLSNEQEGIINVQLLARLLAVNETVDTYQADSYDCSLDANLVIKATPACCTAAHDSCALPQQTCSNAGTLWSPRLTLDRNRSYILFAAYETEAGIACTVGTLLTVAVDGDTDDAGAEGGSANTLSTATLAALSTSLVFVFLVFASLGLVVLRRLRKHAQKQAREIQLLHEGVSQRFNAEVLKDQAKSAQARYNSLQCDRAKIVTAHLLGEGYFGVVHDGNLNLQGVIIPVAVKQLKPGIDRKVRQLTLRC